MKIHSSSTGFHAHTCLICERENFCLNYDLSGQCREPEKTVCSNCKEGNGLEKQADS